VRSQRGPRYALRRVCSSGCENGAFSLGNEKGPVITKPTPFKFAPVLLGAGFLLVVSPILIYWFIHGDADRYLWIINGPAPFNSLGSGPFQLYLYAGLVISGGLLIATVLVAKRR